MKLSLAAVAALLTPLAVAQNFIECNPLKKSGESCCLCAALSACSAC